MSLSKARVSRVKQSASDIKVRTLCSTLHVLDSIANHEILALCHPDHEAG